MKICSKCKKEQALTEFYTNGGGRAGLRPPCKGCIKIYAELNKNTKKNYLKNYYKTNREVLVKKNKAYREVNKEHIALRVKTYYRANKEARTKYAKAYLEANRTKVNAYSRKRYHSDLNFKLRILIRRLINRAFKGKLKPERAFRLLGCDVGFFKYYMEGLFQPGMTFHNIHIDHIRPLVSFDLADPKQAAASSHYTNLQPLWPVDNLKKGAKYPPEKEGNK
jgi:hypothetical protein